MHVELITTLLFIRDDGDVLPLELSVCAVLQAVLQQFVTSVPWIFVLETWSVHAIEHYHLRAAESTDNTSTCAFVAVRPGRAADIPRLRCPVLESDICACWACNSRLGGDHTIERAINAQMTGGFTVDASSAREDAAPPTSGNLAVSGATLEDIYLRRPRLSVVAS